VLRPTKKESTFRSAAKGEWAYNFLFAGTSALLLLVSNLFPAYWYLSFIALLPFLYKAIHARPKAAARLGFLFGLSFFAVSFAGAMLFEPVSALLRIAAGVALFTFFGWATSKAKEKWGFNPILVALFWVVLELITVKLGFAKGIFSEAGLSGGFFYQTAVLFGFLSLSFVIVLFNTLLILAVEKALALLKTADFSFPEPETIGQYVPVLPLFTQKAYLVPAGRAPPLPA